MKDFWSPSFSRNITRVQHVREFLRGLQGDPGPKFPVLLKRVVYDEHSYGRLDTNQAITSPSPRSDACVGIERHSDPGREGILREHEAALRGQYREQESDYFLRLNP